MEEWCCKVARTGFPSDVTTKLLHTPNIEINNLGAPFVLPECSFMALNCCSPSMPLLGIYFNYFVSVFVCLRIMLRSGYTGNSPD